MLPNIVFNKAVVSVQVLNIGTVVAFGFSDGTIEFRNRADLEMLPQDETSNQALNLSQIGFEFPFDGPCRWST